MFVTKHFKIQLALRDSLQEEFDFIPLLLFMIGGVSQPLSPKNCISYHVQLLLIERNFSPNFSLSVPHYRFSKIKKVTPCVEKAEGL